MICARNGKKLNDQAPEMTVKDLRALSEVLFCKDTSKSISHRYLLIFQWQALGRISEISAMQWCDIGQRMSGYVEGLRVMLNRYVYLRLDRVKFNILTRSKQHSQQDLLYSCIQAIG